MLILHNYGFFFVVDSTRVIFAHLEGQTVCCINFVLGQMPLTLNSCDVVQEKGALIHENTQLCPLR